MPGRGALTLRLGVLFLSPYCHTAWSSHGYFLVKQPPCGILEKASLLLLLLPSVLQMQTRQCCSELIKEPNRMQTVDSNPSSHIPPLPPPPPHPGVDHWGKYLDQPTASLKHLSSLTLNSGAMVYVGVWGVEVALGALIVYVLWLLEPDSQSSSAQVWSSQALQSFPGGHLPMSPFSSRTRG